MNSIDSLLAHVEEEERKKKNSVSGSGAYGGTGGSDPITDLLDHVNAVESGAIQRYSYEDYTPEIYTPSYPQEEKLSFGEKVKNFFKGSDNRKDTSGFTGEQTQRFRDLQSQLNEIDRNSGYATTVETSDELEQQRRNIIRQLDELDAEAGREARSYSAYDRADNIIKSWFNRTGASYANIPGSMLDIADVMHGSSTEADRRVADNPYSGWATDELTAANMAAAPVRKETSGFLEQQRQERDRIYEKADVMHRKSQEQYAKGEYGTSAAGSFAIDAATNLADVALDTAVSAFTGISGKTSMGLRVYGSTAQEARLDGDDPVLAMKKGIKAAVIEVITESLTGPFEKAYGKGWGKQALSKFGGKVARTVDRLEANGVFKWFIDSTGEGIEEGLSDVLNTIADHLFGWDDGSMTIAEDIASQKDEILYDMLLGAFVGALGSTTNAVSEGERGRRTKELYGKEGAAALVEEGLLSDEGTKSRRLAERYDEKLKRGKELSGREINQLIEANETAFANEAPRTAEERGAEEPVENTIARIAKTDTEASLLREDYSLGEADAETYARGAEEAYNYGKLGVSMEDAVKNGAFVNELTQAQREHAYKLGQQESKYGTPEQTEDAYDIGESAEAGIDSYAEKFGENADKVRAAYSGDQSLAEFSSAFDAAYNMGKSGVPASETGTAAALSTLSAAQRSTAFDMGRAASAAAAAKAQEAVKAAAKPGVRNRKGVVKSEGVSLKELRASFNDSQRTAYRTLSGLAETFGIDIVLYKSEADASGSFGGEQGKFTWKDNTIYVDINSGLFTAKDVGSLGKYTMLRTFTHEFTHFVEKWNPGQYNNFREFVFGVLAEKGESVNDLIENKMSLDRGGMSYEQASREVIADAMVDILPDSKLVERIAREHESVYKKLLQKLRDFTARLKQYFRDISTLPGREAQALKEQTESGLRYMQSIVELWTNAAEGAVRNYKAAEGTEEQRVENKAKPEAPNQKEAPKQKPKREPPKAKESTAETTEKAPEVKSAEEKAQAKSDEKNREMESGTPSEKTAYRILTEYLAAGKKLTSKELYSICDETFNGTQATGAYDRKAAYDAMELAVNKYLLENAADLNGSTAEDARRGLERVQGILSLLPTQNVRTQEMEQFQQFSTPPNIAYLAAWAADINSSDLVLEPSAGIGGLAAFAKAWGAEVAVNELSERRLAVLKAMGFDHVFNENAEQIDNVLPESIKPTAVIMNPPFSSTAGRTATNKTSNAERHINQALARLSDGGRLVAILGRGMADKAYSKYWDKLRQDYNIRANISIDGENYKKYGTTFDVQLVVIDKTGAQGSAETVTGSYKDLNEIPKILEGIRNDRSAEIERDSAVAGVQEASVETSDAGGQQTVSPAVDTADGGADAGVLEHGSRPGGAGEPRSADVHGGVQRGVQNASAADGAAVQKQRAVAADKKSGKRADRGTDRAGERNTAGDAGGQLNTQRLGAGGLEAESARGQVSEKGRSNKRSDDGVYADYVAPELTIKGSKPHPAVLVESSAMSAVSMPKATYTPHLPENVIKNNLSTEQLVSVTYAGQAHEQTLPNGERKGFFIGDGTGVGKGREISGIILDNFEQGRDKAVWISMNDKLFTDAQRDWVDTTGRAKNEVHLQGKTKLQNKIDFGSGILFTTYPTLRTEKGELSRINQIVEWLGKDFDGVIAFDEAHNMGNLFGSSGKFGRTKGSAMAAAAVKLQSLLPKARVVYVSATAATDVQGLAFASRLGLWGRGTAFTDVNDFVSKIQSSGIAAMELVVRDMKAMGVYVSHSISYNGVSYDTVQHDLDPMQTEIYNTMSRAWQRTMGSVEESLKSTGGLLNSNAKQRAIGQYYSAMQRFYNQVLTSMSMPSVIADMKKELADGKSCVLQIVNTNQAEADRQISSIKADNGSLDDMDLTPRGTLIGYLENCYPIIQYEEYTDENGAVRSRPVTDSKGEPVIDRAAVRKRDALIEEVKQMAIPDGPLEMLFNAFGTDQVAEITGRTRRVVPRKQPDGSMKRVEERRSKTHTAADVQAFQDGDKRILVFSDAGGTGKSYHASRTAKNQQQRVHYVLQPGWVASKAVQGFGRTHRSNQSSAPIYKLVTTNIKGQKRFTSTIARRLDQLGALTKGQRDTGSGMFGAKDNLETDLARDSLREFYRRLGRNQIDGIDGMDTLQRLGLKSKFTDEFGAFKLDDSTSRDISTFLNRILALEVDEQNTLFDAFINIYETEMEAAIQAGTLDTGMENVKADKIEIVDDKVIKEQETTGSATHYIQAKTYTKPKIISTVAAAEGLRSGFMGIYKTKNGDIRAVYRIADKTTEWGEVQKQYKLQSPNATKSSIWKESSFEKNAELLPKGEWQTEWDKEIKKVPEYNEDTKHMLTGTLLPIWYALPDDGNTKVQRLVADDGSTYLGRVISPDKIDDVLKRFNLNRTKESFTAEKVMDSAIKRGARFDLTYYRAQLFRSRVSGEWRLEYKQEQNSWYVARQFPELIHEKINYQDRYFVPLNDEGRAVLDKILEENPVTNTSEEDIDTEHSARAPALSDREVLQYAAENIDTDSLTPGQADALRIFKERVDRLEELQEQRRELGREYKEQQFTPPVDRSAAAETKNRMGILDSKIRSLENSIVSLEDKDVLRQVLKEARRFVEKREREQGDLRLREYRAARAESASLKKYRARVLKETETLREMLMKPSNKNVLKRVPGAIQKTIADFIGAIDFSSKRALRGGELTQADRRIIKNMQAMRDAIKSNIDIQGEYSGYADLPPGFLDRFQSQIDSMQELVNQSGGDYVINKMSAAELRELAHTLRDIRRYVQDMNRFHENAMFQHTEEAGEATIEDLTAKGKAGALRNNGIYNGLAWQYMRPVYGLERLGRGGKSISDEFRRGQAKQAFLAKEIIDFANKTYTAQESKRWSDEVHLVTIGGETTYITTAQAMSFYCLLKRPQAWTHIFGDGIRIANFEKGARAYRDEGHRLTVGEEKAIVALLDARQIEVADKLQKFMSEQCADWGNYVSLARFGTKIFGEENYFPINSDGRYLQATADESPSNAGLYALLNMGFTKELKEEAKNRIIVYDIFDVFANHTASMAQYRSFALPVLDALKWFNYKNDVSSVREKMAAAYGAPSESKPGSGSKSYAESFVLNLLKQYNGTAARGDAFEATGIKGLHRFNRAQVAYNMRVVVQQPLAITRAAQIISPAKLAKGLGMSVTQMKALANEMEAHSGIAAWKAMGFYDTNISRGLTALIKHEQSFAEAVTEKGMWGAEQADRFTWAAMWYACKDSVRRSDYKSEKAYFDAVTELFEDVIYKTQVVDSVLTKAEFLRAQSFFPRMMGSFMSEPSATVSMLVDTYMQYSDALQGGMSKGDAWRKYGGTIRKTITVYAVGQILISAIQAVADAWRDDDDYQSYWEKYLEALKGNAIDNLLPFGNIPYAADLYDLTKTLLSKFGVDTYGNSISNGWMQYAQYLIKSVEIFADKAQGKNTRYTTWGGIYNLLRAVAGMTGLPLATATREVIDVWNNTIGAANPGRKIKTYDSGAKASIKYAYQDGYLSRDEAVEKLQEKGVVTDADKAFLMVKSWETGGKYNELIDAAKNGDRAAFRTALQELTEHGVAERDAYNAVRKSIKERFLDGDLSDTQAISALTSFGDKEYTEARGYVQGWRFSRDYPQYDWTDAEITTYSVHAQPAGISPAVFDRYLTGLDGCKGTDADGDGKTDSGSVRAEAILMIDALPISPAQKDALYLLQWKESTLGKTPWHN